MATAHHHAVSSARSFGGAPEDYIAIHEWFDESKTSMPDNRHRALRHHGQGVVDAERMFGDATRCITITAANGAGNERKIPVRWVAEQHIREDFGFVPSVQDFLHLMPLQPWMSVGARRLSRELEVSDG